MEARVSSMFVPGGVTVESGYDFDVMRKLLIGSGVLVLLFAGALWYFSEANIPRAVLEAKYASPPSRFVTPPDGARAHVRDRGPRDAPALVLIHGSNASLFTWEQWAKRLGDTFRFITIDMPGHGLTGAVPNGDYSQQGMVQFISAVTGALGLQKFAIGGNSMGGRLAARFAEEHPDRATHLILAAAGGIPLKGGEAASITLRLARMPVLNRLLLHLTPRSLIVDGLNDAVEHKEIITPGMIDSYWDFVRMAGTRAATITRFNTSTDNSVKDNIGDIRAPTLILWGEEDRVIPVAAAYEFHSAIPGSQLIVYPGVGHLPHEEVPDSSSAAVRAFLGR
jgi:pimeloyl-ACP methyl ester carboxylesterase